jgi:hypothetical protein
VQDVPQQISILTAKTIVIIVFQAQEVAGLMASW